MLIVTSLAIIFIGFMSYALYRVYGPDDEIVDYFSEYMKAIVYSEYGSPSSGASVIVIVTVVYMIDLLRADSTC